MSEDNNNGGGNIYARLFRNTLAFSSAAEARDSIGKIDRLFNYFERLGDRQGQLQALGVALTGAWRARWDGQEEAVQIFGDWLARHTPGTMLREEPPGRRAERMAMLLKVTFPWLGTHNDAGSGADVITRLSELYFGLLEGAPSGVDFDGVCAARERVLVLAARGALTFLERELGFHGSPATPPGRLRAALAAYGEAALPEGPVSLAIEEAGEKGEEP